LKTCGTSHEPWQAASCRRAFRGPRGFGSASVAPQTPHVAADNAKWHGHTTPRPSNPTDHVAAMPIATRTFRVFVSSTSEDLKAERNALQRDVFPKLRIRLASSRMRFTAGPTRKQLQNSDVLTKWWVYAPRDPDHRHHHCGRPIGIAASPSACTRKRERSMTASFSIRRSADGSMERRPTTTRPPGDGASRELPLHQVTETT
jgi:hypothetical protein